MSLDTAKQASPILRCDKVCNIIFWSNNFKNIYFALFLQFSVEDERLVQAAKLCSPSKRLVIFDARSMLAAGGNRLKVVIEICILYIVIINTDHCFSWWYNNFLSSPLHLYRCLELFILIVSLVIVNPSMMHVYINQLKLSQQTAFVKNLCFHCVFLGKRYWRYCQSLPRVETVVSWHRQHPCNAR